MEKEKTGIITIAVKLFVICFVSTLLLTGVNYVTKGTIAKLEEQAFKDSCGVVMDKMATTEKADVTKYLPKAEAALAYDAEGNLIGICIKQSVKGYNKGLVIMTGVATDGTTVTGIDIMEHSETPGFGALADSEDFTKQFKDKKAPLATIKKGGEIAGITGATKTTNGVIDSGVNKAVEAAKAYLTEEGLVK